MEFKKFSGTWSTPGTPGNPGTPSPPTTPNNADSLDSKSKRAVRRSASSFSALVEEEQLPEVFPSPPPLPLVVPSLVFFLPPPLPFFFLVLRSQELQGFERGVVWEYDPATDEWARGVIIFKLEKVLAPLYYLIITPKISNY